MTRFHPRTSNSSSRNTPDRDAPRPTKPFLNPALTSMSPDTRAKNPEDWAVIVAIQWYPGLSGKHLGGPLADAAAFEEWLVDPSGGGLPVDPTGNRPTIRRVLS